MKNLILHVYYTCKSGMAAAFVQALKDCGAQEKVRADDGCFQYDYFISCEQPDAVVLLEKWRDDAALQAHLAQPPMADIQAETDTYTLDVKVERYE